MEVGDSSIFWLDWGSMSGFENAKVDAAFFGGTAGTP
jgi:hypothetical protein